MKKNPVCLLHLMKNNNHTTKHENDTTSKQHSCVRGPLRECRSIWSGLPYYCTSSCVRSLGNWRTSLLIPNQEKKVPDVLDELAVRRHIKKKKQEKETGGKNKTQTK